MPLSQIVAIVLIAELFFTYYVFYARSVSGWDTRKPRPFWVDLVIVHLVALLIALGLLVGYGVAALASGFWVIE